MRPILFLLLLLPFTTDAQSIFEAEDNRVFYGGLIAGANASQVDGDALSGYHKVGFHGGAQVVARFTPMFGAGLELLYAQKGSLFKGFSEDAYANTYLEEYRLHLNYVSVPLLLHVWMPGSKISYHAGVSYDRLISSKEELSTPQSYLVLNPETFVFKKNSFSAIGGVGYECYRGWLVQLRYEYSLTSIRDGYYIPLGYGGGLFGGQYHNLFTVRLAYFFGNREAG